MKFNSKFTLGAISLQVVGCLISILGYAVDDAMLGEKDKTTEEMTRRLICEELRRERQNNKGMS